MVLIDPMVTELSGLLYRDGIITLVVRHSRLMLSNKFFFLETLPHGFGGLDTLAKRAFLLSETSQESTLKRLQKHRMTASVEGQKNYLQGKTSFGVMAHFNQNKQKALSWQSQTAKIRAKSEYSVQNEAFALRLLTNQQIFHMTISRVIVHASSKFKLNLMAACNVFFYHRLTLNSSVKS